MTLMILRDDDGNTVGARSFGGFVYVGPKRKCVQRIAARFENPCHICGEGISKGSRVVFHTAIRECAHAKCYDRERERLLVEFKSAGGADAA
jgi:hypothetical protein